MRGIHVVAKDSPYRWEQFLAYDQAIIASQYPRPEKVPPDRWAQMVSPSWYSSADDLANAIVGGLGHWADQYRRYLLLDELRLDTRDIIHEALSLLIDDRALAPDEWRRLGVYLVNGPSVSYRNLQPALDLALVHCGIVLPEFYIRWNDYSAWGKAADQMTAAFIRGEAPFPDGRLRYLIERRRELGGNPAVMPVLGVVEKFAGGPGLRYPATMLDRIMYAFVRYSRFRGLALQHGFGSWVWDKERITSSSLDRAFVDSLIWYCDDGHRTPRLGDVR